MTALKGRAAARLLVEQKKAAREQTGWRFAHLRKGNDRRRYRLKRKGRVYFGEVETPTGWRWIGELKPTTVNQSFDWDPPGQFRQLVRVTRIEGKKVFVVVPGMGQTIFETPRSIYPPSWRLATLRVGLRFFCVVDMRAPPMGPLTMVPPFELGEAPDPDDGLGPTTDPLSVVTPGIPPTLRPEEIVEASADIQELHEFIEKMISVVYGPTGTAYASPIQKALRRCIRLRMLMQVADARLNAKRSA